MTDGPAARLRLCTLGGLTLLGSDDVPLGGAAGQPSRLAVLAVLAVGGARPTSRDRLLALLWPERDRASGRQALSQALYALRRAAGDRPLVVGAGTEALRLDPEVVATDLDELTAALARGEPDAAARLYAGPFLDGIHVSGAGTAFEQWVDDERRRLAALAERALETLATRAEAAGDAAVAAAWWRRLGELDPVHAGAAAGLMRALDAVGDRAGALRHAEQHARRVRDELGTSPSPAVLGLVERLRADAPPSADARPEREPAATAVAASPLPPVRLVGRERELAVARALLDDRDVRLLTLTGAGGSGKTTLALRLAADLAAALVPADADDASAGALAHAAFAYVAFVDLSAIRDPVLVIPAVAAALGVRDRTDVPLADAIAAALGARRALVVLDNLEQVVAAAPEIARLLATVPGLAVLATSRVRLQLRAERELSVEPLALPDLAAADVHALRAADAVELFAQRVREARPDLVLDRDDETLRAVAEICVRLDGLPLALELAAARTRLLAPRAILARLRERRLDLLTDGARDLPQRQRTLRGAIAWSYDLLRARERAALRALGAFAGPFALPAMAAVVGAAEDDALALAQTLVDASLLRRAADAVDGPRLVMLETIREFARERLRAEHEERVARERHRAWYQELVDRLAPSLVGADQAEALSALERDRADVQAALEWASTSDDPAPLARLALALWRAWLVQGRWTEGREWIARALARGAASDATARTVRAELLGAAASLAQNQGDYAAAFASAEAALAEWHALGHRAGEARTLATMGWLAWRRGAYDESRRLSGESLALHRALGDERGAAQALANLGWVAHFAGAYDEAATMLAESLAVRRRVADRRDIAFALAALAWATLRAGDAARARMQLDEALATFAAIGERQLHAFASMVAAEAALVAAPGDEARERLAESVATFRELGDRWGECAALGLLGEALLADGRIDEADDACAAGLAIALALDDAHAVATGEARAALVAAARGDPAAARALAGAATARMRALGGAFAPGLARRLAELATRPT